MTQALTHVEDLADFIDASPSSYHAAEESARRLEEQGFTRLAEHDEWPAQPSGKFVVAVSYTHLTLPTKA